MEQDKSFANGNGVSAGAGNSHVHGSNGPARDWQLALLRGVQAHWWRMT